MILRQMPIDEHRQYIVRQLGQKHLIVISQYPSHRDHQSLGIARVLVGMRYHHVGFHPILLKQHPRSIRLLEIRANSGHTSLTQTAPSSPAETRSGLTTCPRQPRIGPAQGQRFILSFAEFSNSRFTVVFVPNSVCFLCTGTLLTAKHHSWLLRALLGLGYSKSTEVIF
jgi:hypothetical protein